MRGTRTGRCRCPYCDTPLAEGESFCSPCGVKIDYCHKCGTPLPRDSNTCPECGEARRGHTRRKRS
ncbi:MAG: zinc-ribbon domain-containing protein [candidate division WOR-3 bacterium]